MSKTNRRTVEIFEYFTFADGSVRLAWVKWRLWNHPVTGVESRRCIGVRG